MRSCWPDTVARRMRVMASGVIGAAISTTE
jgi:hypothetical protein